MGSIDILVNNSGVSTTQRIQDVTEEDFDYIFDTNAKGSFFVAQEVGKRMLARLHQDGSSIVLKVGNETRDHLLQADPQTFFITDHYRGYPMVLAYLDRLSAADLRKLLVRALSLRP